MTTVYNEGIVQAEADAVLGTMALRLADGTGDLAQFLAATGAAGTVNLVLSKHGGQLATSGLAADLRYLSPAYVAPVRAEVNSAGTIADGRQFRGPAAEKVLLWKANDGTSTVIADPATGRIRCVFGTSAVTGITATGGAGTGVLEFSDLTVAAELATALQAACDLTPYEGRISD